MAISASSGFNGVSRVSMGIGVPTPVNFSTFIDSELVQFSESVIPAPAFDASIHLELPYGHYVGISSGINIFPTKNAEYINTISVRSDYAMRFDVNEYVVPLEAGIGLAMFKKGDLASFGLALSLRTGIEYNVTDNFFVGLDASIMQFLGFGLYLDYALVTYQMVAEPKVVAGVRW